MCGIAGILSPHHSAISLTALQKMAHVLSHRGPDGEGFWVNEKTNVGFAHRRLAIIDLSPAAAQPMHYLSRYSIVYNGEIYNYKELRKDLQKAGYSFKSQSDTEVILAAYDCYRERCLQYFDGMFAFALWDEKQQTLCIARDRFGEKPFYFHSSSKAFYFASEMKAFWTLGIERTPENKMLLNYLSLGNVQNPSNKQATFYKNILSLPPAHYAIIPLQTMQVSIKQYWDIDKQFNQKLHEDAILHRLELLLKTSVERRLRSDVALGSSLSGGIDSSAIAWYVHDIMHHITGPANFKTFTAVFPGFEKDESLFAKEVSDSLAFQNFQVSPRADELASDLKKIFYFQEEPFPSSSIFAQYKVYELARQHGVKVLLDGQGADEILAGYNRYLHWYIQELLVNYQFRFAAKEKNRLLQNYKGVKWGLKNIAASFFPSHVAIALEKREYNKIVSNHDIAPEFMQCIKGREWDGIHKPIITKLNDILYFSTMQMGLEELLRYADRNSMAHGVEVRLPFLNAEMVQFIFSISSSQKIKEGFTKWPLRKLMDNRLPHSIVWRKEKIGFEPPQKQWMNSDAFRNYLFDAKKKLISEKLLRPAVLKKQQQNLDAFEANNTDWRYACAAQMFY